MLTQQVSSQATVPTTDASDFTAPMISKEDMEMSLEVVRYSVKISCILMRKPEKKIQQNKKGTATSTTVKLPIPEPENMTIDYLLSNYTHTHDHFA